MLIASVGEVVLQVFGYVAVGWLLLGALGALLSIFGGSGYDHDRPDRDSGLDGE